MIKNIFLAPRNFLNRTLAHFKKNSISAQNSNFFLSPTQKTGWSMARVFQIYSASIASAEYSYERGDGVDELLQKGFKGYLKQALDIAQNNSKAFILLAFSEDPEKVDFTKPPLSQGDWCFLGASESLPENIHPSRYLRVENWRDSKSLAGLKHFGDAIDRIAMALPETIEMLNHTIIKVGSYSSLSDFLHVSEKEINQFASLMPRLSTEKFNFIGKDDEVFNINRQEHISTITPQMGSLFSFISGCPLNLVSGDGASTSSEDKAFIKEIQSLQEIIVAPLINEILQKTGRSSHWSFLHSQNEKEKKAKERNQIVIEEIQILEKLQERKEKLSLGNQEVNQNQISIIEDLISKQLDKLHNYF